MEVQLQLTSSFNIGDEFYATTKDRTIVVDKVKYIRFFLDFANDENGNTYVKGTTSGIIGEKNLICNSEYCFHTEEEVKAFIESIKKREAETNSAKKIKKHKK